jgi:hypothetical protein
MIFLYTFYPEQAHARAHNFLSLPGEKLLAKLGWSRRDQPHDGSFHHLVHKLTMGVANISIAVC